MNPRLPFTLALIVSCLLIPTVPAKPVELPPRTPNIESSYERFSKLNARSLLIPDKPLNVTLAAFSASSNGVNVERSEEVWSLFKIESITALLLALKDT